MNSFQKVIIPVSFFILSVFNVLFAQTANRINWKEDLKVYKESLEQKHIDIFHTITKEDFIKEWREIYNNLNQLSDFEVIINLMRLTRRINDGHTAVSIRNISTHRFPIEISLIEGKWRVIKTVKKYDYLLGQTLVSINNTPIKEIALKVSEVAQFVENKYSLKERTASYLPISELLFYLKLIKFPDIANFSFLDHTGKRQSVPLTAINNELWVVDKNKLEMTTGIPEIKKVSDSGFWFRPIANTKALYIYFKTYPTFEEMQNFGNQLVTYIQENQLRQVVIDLRENGGGDLYVGTVLAYALNLSDSIDWKDGVFVLTSNRTFSAATSNSALFKQLLNAKIVGQPTGSNPNGYQDMDSFVLPSSKLVISYSKRVFRLSNELNSALKPNLIIKQKWQDFIYGTDTVLNELLKIIKKQQF